MAAKEEACVCRSAVISHLSLGEMLCPSRRLNLLPAKNNSLLSCEVWSSSGR